MMLMTLRLSLLCQAFYDQVMFVQNDTFQGAMLPVVFSFFLDLSLIEKAQSALKPREITFYNVRICRDNIMK